MPAEPELQKALAGSYSLWTELRVHVKTQYPKFVEEWNYPGQKYGWSYRLKDKKRVIIYLLPREGYFKAAMVFGQKASEMILESSVKEEIKEELRIAKVYAEGRGIRIDIKSKAIVKDIKKLIDIKLLN